MFGKGDQKKVIQELQAGHLGNAMQLVEKGNIKINDQIREAAVIACYESLKRHYHWIIPSFVETFQIKNDPRLHQLAAKIIVLSLQHDQPLITNAVAQAFGIRLDASIMSRVDQASAQLFSTTNIGGKQVLSIQGMDGEYDFKID